MLFRSQCVMPGDAVFPGLGSSAPISLAFLPGGRTLPVYHAVLLLLQIRQKQRVQTRVGKNQRRVFFISSPRQTRKPVTLKRRNTKNFFGRRTDRRSGICWNDQKKKRGLIRIDFLPRRSAGYCGQAAKRCWILFGWKGKKRRYLPVGGGKTGSTDDL